MNFWRGNRTELYFPSKFSKSRRSQRRKLSFVAVPLKILSRKIFKNVAEVNAEKKMRQNIIKQKTLVWNFYLIRLIGNDVLWHCPCCFSIFLLLFCLRSHIDYPIILRILKLELGFSKFCNCSIKLSTWRRGSTHEIELLTRVSKPNLNPNRKTRMNRFIFGAPEPNLNQQNFTSVNLNQTWTLKIVLKWTQTEPEPLTKVRIFFFHIWSPLALVQRTIRAVVIINRISNFFFFSGWNE